MEIWIFVNVESDIYIFSRKTLLKLGLRTESLIDDFSFSPPFFFFKTKRNVISNATEKKKKKRGHS